MTENNDVRKRNRARVVNAKVQVDTLDYHVKRQVGPDKDGDMPYPAIALGNPVRRLS
jgi:hypothetical protein